MFKALLKKREIEEVPAPKKTWDGSQKYELEHAITFMDSPDFRKLHRDIREGNLNLSAGHRDSLMLHEFFGDSPEEFDRFVKDITGKTTLDIGPCTLSPTAAWDVASERYAIEPLIKAIEQEQRTNYGGSCFENITTFDTPAEKRIPELVDAITGAIVCRNTIDHSPNWAFILSNISAYAAPGCKLLLWNDIDHRGTADEGHYDITSDTESFKNLIEALGFRVIREYSDRSRAELNWGCFAEKI